MHRLTLFLLVTLTLALPAGAMANPTFEPNDGIHQAFGPLEADTSYDAAISADEDSDWYILYTSGPGVVDVKVTALSGCCPFVRLLDRDGKELNSTEFIDPGESDHIVYTAPGADHYYVKITSLNPGNNYRLHVSGPLTAGPRPGPAEATPNNNSDLATAFGPLLGGKLYGGSIDANDEEDWFFFYTAGPGAFDVAITGLAIDRCCALMRLLDQDGDQLNSTEFIDHDTIEHLRYTAAGPAKFVLRVTGLNPGSHYQFRIDPASLLTTVPPPPPSPAAPAAKKSASAQCRRARTARKKAFANYKKAQRKAAITKRKSRSARRAKARRNWRKSKRRWAKATKKRRASLTNANRRMKAACAY